jgi:hypothetical protein
VPHDPEAGVRARRPEAVRGARRADLGRCARAVLDRPLEDGDLVDQLALAQRDLAEGAAEGAREREGDALVDDEGSVRADADDDVGAREVERLRRSRRRERERREGRDAG